MNRLYAIPDIHGELGLLKDLWQQLVEDEGFDLAGGDRVVFMGDMVDRGPDSRGVILFVRQLLEKHPASVTVLAGNHEYLMIDRIERGRLNDVLCWSRNGGDETQASYPAEGRDKLMKADVQWLKSLPLSHTEQGFFFSHAPLPMEEDRAPQNQGAPFTRDELIWTYHHNESLRSRDMRGEGLIGVCGHIHALRRQLMHPRLYEHYLFCDAGAGCHVKAPLVAVEVKTRRVLYAWPSHALETQSGAV
jgi:hypothetical protein